MKIYNFFFKKNLYFFILFFLTVIIFFIPILNKPLIINSDWTFPETREQLYFFGTSQFSIFSFKENILGSYINHQNDYFFRFFALLCYFLGFDGAGFQKFTILLLLILICIFSRLLFFELFKNENTSLLASIVYIFSPVYFDYYTMGWIYVILYYTFQPLIFYCLIKLYQTRSYKYILILFAITPILFSQSQSPLWIIIILCVFCIQKLIEENNFLFQIKFFSLVFFIICISILITNFSWILIPNEIIYKGVTEYDFNRFRTTNFVDVLSFLNNIHNKFYLSETLLNGIFNKVLSLAIIVILFLHICKFRISSFENNTFKNNYYISSVLLFFFPFLILLTYSIWYKFPYAGVFRDVLRFNVIGYLGFTILIINTYKLYSNKIYKLILIIFICINLYPFLDLYNTFNTKKNSFLKFFSFNDSNLESNLNKYEKNIIIPTGGHMKLFSDNTKYDFYSDYFEIGDTLSFFSPTIVNFFTHDKASTKEHTLTNFYIYSYLYDEKEFFTLNKIFGINNIFYRKDALSTFNNSFGTIDKKFELCEKLEANFIYKKCKIKDAYNEIHISDKIYFSNFLKVQNHHSKELVTQLSCDDYFKKKYDCNEKMFKAMSPKIEYDKKSNIYNIKIYDVGEPFILNLNRSFSKFWKIKTTTSNYRHIEGNSFINSWYFYPNEKINLLEIEIFNDYEENYKRNFKIQIILYFLLVVLISYFILKNEKKNW
jgi:hypothetical protein